ncbi:MAG: flagellar brake protein [Comamonadaceae bacterium]
METPPKEQAKAEPNSVPTAAPGGGSAQASLFADMHLRVGSQVHLDLSMAASGGRATTTVLGWLEGVSLMVTAPQSATGHRRLLERERVLVRAFNGKSAFAFRATVLSAVHQPFQYFHLSFPDTVETVEIRSSPRCRVRLPGVISVGGKTVGQGAILNIGTAGALIETEETLTQEQGVIQITCSFELHGVPVSLVLHAKVRDTKGESAGSDKTHHQYGLAFEQLQPNDRLILGSLVWYQMYEHPKSII